MTLNEIAKAITNHGFEVQLREDVLRVYRGIVHLDSVTVLEVFNGGNSCFIVSEEDGIQYGIDRVSNGLECDQWLGVLEDRREMVQLGKITVEIEADHLTN